MPPLGHPPFGPPGFGPPPDGFEMPQADVSGITRKWLDVAYASTSAAQQFDVFLPESGSGPFPVLMHIHGGAFAIGDKRDGHLEAYLRGLDHGYAVVSINYRLSGEAIFPAGLQDVKAAIRWLRANGAAYSLDPARIAACGASSGANYASMMGVTAGVAQFEDPALGNAGLVDDVQAVVDWFGPTDFLKMDEHLAANGLGPCDHSTAGSPESLYLGAPIGDVPEKVRQANPITYVNANMPPILIQHGRADNLVPVQQSIEFAEAIDKIAGPGRAELDLLDGAGHDDPAFSTSENMARVFAFLDRHLK